HDLIKTSNNKNILWANIVIPLDRPIVDNVVFSKILDDMEKNKYPLLENVIQEINEHNMFSVYLMTICYYIENGRKLTNLKSTDPLNIVVHVHQDIRCLPLIAIIKNMISGMIKEHNIGMTNTVIDYKTDKPF